MLLGILLMICGTAAIVFPPISSLVAVTALSIVLLVAGVAMIVGAFWTGKWSGFLIHLLVGILYVAGGMVIADRPLVSTLLITMFLAISFMVMGIFRAVGAMVLRFPQWGWALMNGLVTFLLGLIIYRHLPLDAFWVIGVLVGIEMLLNGWTWIMLSTMVRRQPMNLDV
jgi:uncharacterized membrane protein HdeD (DUF308 family)